MAFSTAQELNYFARNYINPKIIARIDKAIADGLITDTWGETVSTILLHKKDDSAISTCIRLAYYYFEFNGLGNITEPGVEIAKIYGIPLDTLQESVRWIPQIKIFFREVPSDASSAIPPRRPREARLSIRCNETIKNNIVNDINKTYVKELATKIANILKNITYQKGYEKYHYRDLDKNYKLSVFTASKAEAQLVITAALKINDDIPDFLNFLIEPKTEKNYTAPKTQKILGEDVLLPAERTTGNMLFYKAELHWKGIEPIILVNNSPKHKGAIIELKYL
jgi:hypothetical protein